MSRLALAETNLFIPGEQHQKPHLYAAPEAEEPQEEYAHSHSVLRTLGAIIVARQAKLNYMPKVPERRKGLANFTSGVTEMLATDEDSKELVDIDIQEDYKIIDGKACDVDGTSLWEMVNVGERNSAARASVDSRFNIQNLRDNGDKHAIKTADSLNDGEAYLTVSNSPKEGLKKHPKIYKKYLGYREPLIYVQWFAKQGDVLTAGASSFYVTDEEAFKEELAASGIVIPPGESPDTWIMHGIKEKFSPEQTKEFILDLRERYYKRVGLADERFSVSELVEQNAQIVEGFFEAYYPALSKAVYTGRNNEVMQQLAQAMLKTDLTKMKVEARSHLMKVANSGKFDDELGKTMDSIIRYAVVEELRKGLKARLDPSAAGPQVMEWPSSSSRSSSTRSIDFNYINQLLASNVSSGVGAGRSYGGCASVELAEENNDPYNWGASYSSTSDLPNSYTFGGRGGSSKEKWKTKKGTCVIDSCPTRPGKVKVGPCGVCMERCQKLYNDGKDPAKNGSVTRKVASVSLGALKPRKVNEGSNTTKNSMSYSYN